MSRWLRSFSAFWYDFVIGDDWRGAAVVAAALALTALLVHVAHVNAWWLLPVCVLAALGWSLRRATRASDSISAVTLWSPVTTNSPHHGCAGPRARTRPVS